MIAKPLFAGAVITTSMVDVGREIPFLAETGNWISIGLAVTQVVPGVGGSISFRLQWSFDNVTWCEANPGDVLGTTSSPVAVIQRFDVKAPYFRLAATVAGTGAAFTCTANALV